MQEAIPLRESEHGKLAVTFELFQPAALAAGEDVPPITGGVLSRLILAEAVALNPARLTAVPVTVCFAPPVVTATGGLQEAMPRIVRPRKFLFRITRTSGFVRLCGRISAHAPEKNRV